MDLILLAIGELLISCQRPLLDKVREDTLFNLTESTFTSAGVSAGIDLALRIVSHFFGTGIGNATARHMEYSDPESDMRRGTSDT